MVKPDLSPVAASVAGSTALVDQYPFESHYLDVQGVAMHYVDEGAGAPVVMLHGNPTWSFYYRRLIAGLRNDVRVIAPDHIGCGLSEKPGDDRYEYTLERRVSDLEALLNRLEIREPITLVLHDWGGMIGLVYAVRHPKKIARLVVLNTACGGLPKTKRLPTSIRLGRNTRLGEWLIRGGNAFLHGALRWGCIKPIAPEARWGYLAPYDSWAHRIAVLRFVQDIPLQPGDRAYDALREVEENLGRLRGIPMLICWGEKDFVFDEHFLREWETKFPEANIHRFPNAGHFVLEDAAEQILPLVRRHLELP